MNATSIMASRPAPMTLEEYGRLLNVLLESERNCALLIHLLLEEGLEPSAAVGGFYRKGLGIRGWNERLRFLNRGQQWVADCIAAALPRLVNFSGRKPLQAMYDSHLLNIAICKEQMT